MNWTRFIWASLGVFLGQAIVAGLLFAVWVGRRFSDPAFFRPEGDQRLVVYFACRIMFVALFVYLFASRYRGRKLVEGLRFGIMMWLFYSIPMTVGFWAFIRMPDGLAVAWIVVGLAEMVAGGLVVSAVYRPRVAMEVLSDRS